MQTQRAQKQNLMGPVSMRIISHPASPPESAAQEDPVPAAGSLNRVRASGTTDVFCDSLVVPSGAQLRQAIVAKAPQRAQLAGVNTLHTRQPPCHRTTGTRVNFPPQPLQHQNPRRHRPRAPSAHRGRQLPHAPAGGGAERKAALARLPARAQRPGGGTAHAGARRAVHAGPAPP